MIKLILGDCLEEMKELENNSIDAIVTDPPYELGFMGKAWDNTGIANNKEMWAECLRVLKPGGYLLAFGGTRTYHRMAVAIEDAGFEVRDMIEWIYGSGFPKSLNIGKAVDKLGGQSLSWFIDYILQVADEKGISRKELTMLFPSKNGNPTGWLWNKQKTQGITLEQYHKIKEFLKLPFADINECEREVIGRGKAGLTAGTIANFAGEKEFDLTKGTSEWEGWGTALKPAHEPICVARKPLSEKTVALNCLKWGTGGINIDESRVDGKTEIHSNGKRSMYGGNSLLESKTHNDKTEVKDYGRFPANLLHDNSEEVRECFPNESEKFFKSIIYQAKASKAERNAGCEGLEDVVEHGHYAQDEWSRQNMGNTPDAKRKPTKNNHPTVKPIALMEYLIKMVTPKGGTVLDPFIGSGTTGVACKNLNRNFIGIEMDEGYIKIAEARLK